MSNFKSIDERETIPIERLTKMFGPESHGPMITIIVKGGVVQNIEDIPPHLIVKVIDFDVDGCEESRLENVEGDLASISYWGG